MPLIRALRAQGHEVQLASDGRAGLLLQDEFPELTYHELPSYRIRYSTSNMMWNMAGQLPRLMWAVRAEGRFLKQLAQKEHIQL